MEVREPALCNLYLVTKGQQSFAIVRAMNDRIGNLPPLPCICPDYAAPIIRNSPEGRELTTARWGMPSTIVALKKHSTSLQICRNRAQKCGTTRTNEAWRCSIL